MFYFEYFIYIPYILFSKHKKKILVSLLFQLTLFLSKLTGPSIGITALGFVTITKELLLTVGIFVHYKLLPHTILKIKNIAHLWVDYCSEIYDGDKFKFLKPTCL